MLCAVGPFSLSPSFTPCRLLDTRTPQDGPAFVSGVTEVMVLTGACGIPANASAVALNVTVTQSSGGDYLILFPGRSLSGAEHQHDQLPGGPDPRQ